MLARCPASLRAATRIFGPAQARYFVRKRQPAIRHEE
jgi:hypothetical protein